MARRARLDGFCLMCPDETLAAGRLMCRACTRGLMMGGPFSLWVDTLGFSEAEIAEWAQLSRRTVSRAVDGQRISQRAAEKLAALTGLPLETFRPPAPPKDPA